MDPEARTALVVASNKWCGDTWKNLLLVQCFSQICKDIINSRGSDGYMLLAYCLLQPDKTKILSYGEEDEWDTLTPLYNSEEILQFYQICYWVVSHNNIDLTIRNKYGENILDSAIHRLSICDNKNNDYFLKVFDVLLKKMALLPPGVQKEMLSQYEGGKYDNILSYVAHCDPIDYEILPFLLQNPDVLPKVTIERKCPSGEAGVI